MIPFGVVDYGMGNLKSICNALSHLGANPVLCSSAGEIARVERLIIPGVGAYRAAMDNLRARGLVDPLRAHAASGRPVLGICLGMQLLSTAGTEPDRADGLDLVPGQVVPLPEDAACRVPHVGWNSALPRRAHPLLVGIKPGLDWYFVHSYRFLPADDANEIATTEYGVAFASMVGRRNVFGVQFHPEKSQDHGLRLLENFTNWDGTC